ELPQIGDLTVIFSICGNYHKLVTYRHILNLWELPQIGSDHPDNTKISIGILNSIRYLKRGFLEFL
uniref:hypothetical protein n=2 Tax=Leptospira interrogans TaxID=173 RepID=UPI0002B9F620